MNVLGPAIAVMGIIGAIFGIGLAFAGYKFRVQIDPRVTQVRSALPGANCGGCGFPGCDGLADAIVGGRASADACKPGGAKAAEAIASIMGVAVDTTAERKVAQVMCGGGSGLANERSTYVGIQTCPGAMLAGSGSKACTFGCLGYGTCVSVCPFNAIHMGPDGLPVVDKEKCTACGNCVKACPRAIISLVPVSKVVHVRCKNTDPGAVVRKVCKVGCIGCQICVKACPTKAMQFAKNLAYIDYDLCNNCGTCAQKCPTKAIKDYAAVEKQAASA
ncbi:MAG: RnfABCDGE type electron transport complex subunit B [Bacillota bacterium]|nr:RnfABCDGE type electron transport complex subunit B [Bacillota bacterium]